MAMIATVTVFFLMCLVFHGSCTRLKTRGSSKVDQKFSRIVDDTEHTVSSSVLHTIVKAEEHTTVKAEETNDVTQNIRYSALGHHTPPFVKGTANRSNEVGCFSSGGTHRGIAWKFKWKLSGTTAANPFRWSLMSLTKETIIQRLRTYQKSHPGDEVTIKPQPYGGKFYGSIDEAIAWINALTHEAVSRCVPGGEPCECTGKVYFVQQFVSGGSSGKELEYPDMTNPNVVYYWTYLFGSADCTEDGLVEQHEMHVMRRKIRSGQPAPLVLEPSVPKQCFCDNQPLLAFNAFTKNQYTVGKQVSRGGFGRVLIATDRASGARLIVKFIPLENQDPDFPNEFKLQKEAESAFVPTIHAEHQVGGHSFFVMAEAPGVDLSEYLQSVRWKIDEDTARAIVVQLAMAVQGCHERYIAHRDIKPENIRYNPNAVFDLRSDPPQLSLMLIDFGFAAKRTGSRLFGTPGTARYAAPDLFAREGYWEAVDIWSMGVILYQLAFLGIFPFGNDPRMPSPDIVDAIKYDPISFSGKAASWASTPFMNLLKSMLTKDPHQRINIEGVLNDPWVSPAA